MNLAFLLAKMMGVSVENFLLGFGPKLIGKKNRRGLNICFPHFLLAAM